MEGEVCSFAFFYYFRFRENQVFSFDTLNLFAAFMSKCYILLLFTLLFLFTLFSNGYSQDHDVEGIRLMFYNVENLFDIYDDTLKEDNDFLPDGVMRWTHTRYNKKINSVYKTITAAGEWSMPVIIALCEVENRKVLGDLLFNSYLSKYNFGIVHEDSPDLRGIDVCMIYRKDCAQLLNYRYLIPSNVKPAEFHTRSVLYSKFLIQKDTLNIIVNHWPSRRGGALAGEDLRLTVAEMVKSICDSILRVSSARAKIIICGDFNCTPDDIEIKELMNREKSFKYFYNLSERYAQKGEGSYRYRGIWEMIDQVIVSESLLKSDYGLYTAQDNFKIFNPGFLLEKDPVYPGLSPFATYRGYRYHGGFSDHLPVLLDLNIK